MPEMSEIMRAMNESTMFRAEISIRTPRELFRTIAGQSWIDMRHQPVLALESERLMLETLEGACEQARRRQEDERKSRLKHHEDGARE